MRNKAVYVALAITVEGDKEVLGLWIEQTEGAKFWLKVMNELKACGDRDILIAVVDGLASFPDAIERAGLVLLDPDPDQVAGDVVALRESVQGLAGQELLRDQPLELDAVGSVSCHGFHPPKAQITRSIRSAPTVRPEGPNPIGGSTLDAD